MFKVIAAYIATVLSSTGVKDCSTGKEAFKVNAVTLAPSVPVPGQNVTLHLDYTVPSGMVVTDGLATYATTYNFIPLTPTTEPLCANVPCPLSSGTYANDTTTLWPTGLSGTLVSRMSWADSTNAPLLCIEISGKV